MKSSYIRAMDGLHRLCMVLAGTCLVVITVIIPWGVFTRYVLGYGSSWPEPAAVLLMIWFSFLSAAICYRENLHIGVAVIPMMLGGQARIAIGWMIEIAMAGTNLFMLVWGVRLVQATWHQAIAEFPGYSVGLSYLPVPLGGAITALFVIERLWTGALFAAPADDSLTPISSEEPAADAPSWTFSSWSAASPSSACSACRSPMRSASPPSWRRSGSTCRSKRSC
jgi:TRAP-type C4-dicarboxylate transport system permease small subunit